MLLPSEVAPLLVLGDSRVLLFAITYLAGAHDPGPLTADDIWAAIDRVRGDDRYYLFMYLSALPSTPSSV